MTTLRCAGHGLRRTLVHALFPVPTALGIAVHRGWFDEEFGPDGITLNSLQETADAGKRESHFDHSLPHSFRQGGNIPALGRGHAAPIRA